MPAARSASVSEGLARTPAPRDAQQARHRQPEEPGRHTAAVRAGRREAAAGADLDADLALRLLAVGLKHSAFRSLKVELTKMWKAWPGMAMAPREYYRIRTV